MQLNDVHIILVGTTHPGNIGAAARAMKTMGLSRLDLVAPRHFPSAEATARASGADDLLTAARVFDTLPEAVSELSLVYATTARQRRFEWPVLDPREAAAEMAERLPAGSVGVVFGREQSGLSNDELECCQRAIRIPTARDFASLNLAQAVQVVAYEIGFLAEAARHPVPSSEAGTDPAASGAELKHLVGHFERVMEAVGFLDPTQPKLIRRRLARLTARAGLLHSEVQILRGFLARVEARIGRDPNDA